VFMLPVDDIVIVAQGWMEMRFLAQLLILVFFASTREIVVIIAMMGLMLDSLPLVVSQQQCRQGHAKPGTMQMNVAAQMWVEV
jgi:hypothetical protein